MKQITLNNQDLAAVMAGQKHQLHVVHDRQDLNLDDVVVVLNEDQAAVGELEISQLRVMRLRDAADQNVVLRHLPAEQVVDPGTAVKEINFVFTQYDQKQPLATNAEKNTTAITEVKLYGDGGSRGNPGPAASGWVLYDMHDNVIKEGGYYMGITTNNQAEYTALKLGLKDAKKLGAKRVQVFMDSMLVVNQLKGIYRVKNQDLRPIYEAIRELAKDFDKVTYTHVPRARNAAADAMVNKTLDDVAAGN